jgi:hypothetical protein
MRNIQLTAESLGANAGPFNIIGSDNTVYLTYVSRSSLLSGISVTVDDSIVTYIVIQSIGPCDNSILVPLPYASVEPSYLDVYNNDYNWYSNPFFPSGPGDIITDMYAYKNFDYDNYSTFQSYTSFPNLDSYDLKTELPILNSLSTGDTIELYASAYNDAYEGQANLSINIKRNGVYVITETFTNTAYVDGSVSYTIPAGTTSLLFEASVEILNTTYY